MTNKKRFDIYDRALEFAIRVGRLMGKLPKNQAVLEYSRQLIRASASIGANIEEADGVLTKKDFVNKMGIARRESRESRHWVRLIKEVGTVSNLEAEKELEWQLGEAKEIMLILSSIINNTRNNDS